MNDPSSYRLVARFEDSGRDIGAAQRRFRADTQLVVAALSLTAAGIDVVLLDIEGTTTPIAFVHDVLFPYARARVRAYLERSLASDAEIRQIVEDLRVELPASGFQLPAESRAGSWQREPRAAAPHADIVSYVHWLMDRDRKSGPLKALQGRIWEEGYRHRGIAG